MTKLLSLAARNLRRNRRRTAISLVALMIGVAVMVCLRGFINGQKAMMLENIVSGSLGAVQVHKAGYLANVQALPLTFEMNDSPQLRAKMAAVDHVVGVSPRITFGAMISTPDLPGQDGRTSYFAATAVEPDAEHAVAPRRWAWVQQGRFFQSADAPEILLNADLNDGLAAPVMPDAAHAPPDTQWPALLAADKDGSLNGISVRVSGTLSSAMPGDHKFGIVPLAVAQKLLRMEGKVTEYALQTRRLEDANQVKADLQRALGADYEVHTWDEILPFVNQLVNTADKVFGAISMVFLIIVLLGIVNTLLMNVLERIREIGTMLAVGMRRSQIATLFLFEGAVLGVIGAVLGALLGAAITAWLHQRGILLPAPGSNTPSMLRPTVSVAFLFRTIGIATLGSALSALYPAIRASKLRPVEALAST